MDGFISISRKIAEHWLWQDAERLKWWIDLLFMANWKDSKVLVGNELIELKRGQFTASIRYLQDRWARRDKRGNIIERPSLKRVLAFLVQLEREMMVTRENRKHQISVITICNYDKYQLDTKESGNTCGNTFGNTCGNKTNKDNKDNNNKEKIEKESGAELSLFADAEQEAPKPKTTKPTKRRYAPEVLLTEAEYSKLVQAYGQDGADWMIKKLDDYKAACGRTYKSDYRAILNWVVKEYQKQTNQMNYGTSEINRQYNQADAQRQRDAEFADYLAKKLGGDGVR